MTALDWAIVALYLAGSLTLGLYLARRGSGTIAEFFVGGRSVPWWLAATSMAATTFNVDTPLYVAGRVAKAGVAGNWEWWSFALAHVFLAVFLAKLWRRAHVLTDMELTELRYGGTPAAALRATRAFIFAVPLNCLSMGYGMLAMRKVV
ncbi:MAG TPA: Na+:solute symporter, partial [Gemmatimonadales bacterium]|nr:Na+:solute symporter [Gemmatimonadales bacterium]